MPTTVEIPHVGDVEFPDSMSQSEINAASKKLYTKATDGKTFDGSLNPLVAKIRAKYPNEYDDLDDATLTTKLLAKYPEYIDLAAPHFDTSAKAPGLTDAAEAFKDGQPITPQNGESFLQTMQRAARAGKTVTPEEITGQTIEGVKDLPVVLGSAAGIGVAGPAVLAGAGEAGGAAVNALGNPVVQKVGGQALKFAVKSTLEAAGAGGAYALIKHLFGDK